LGLVKAAKG